MSRKSQDGVKEFRTAFDNAPFYGHGPGLEDFSEMTPLTGGSPQQVIDRYAAMHAQTYGKAVDVATLIPHMLEAFIGRDRGFRAQSHMQQKRATRDTTSP